MGSLLAKFGSIVTWSLEAGTGRLMRTEMYREVVHTANGETIREGTRSSTAALGITSFGISVTGSEYTITMTAQRDAYATQTPSIL